MTDWAFLHGGGQGSWVWAETIAALTPHVAGRTLALDVPGCGVKRDRDTAALDNRDIARELVEDLERAGLRDIVLVGHSQAGQILPLMAALRPALFRRLVYLACSIPLPGQTVLEMIGTGPQGARDDTVGLPFDPATVRAEDRNRLMFCNDMAADEADAFLAKLGKDAWPMPTYAFTDWGCEDLGVVPASYGICLRDRILPAAWQRRFAERFRAHHTIDIDAGHQAMTTQPQRVAEALLAAGGDMDLN